MTLARLSWRLALNNLLRRLIWLRILVLVGWVVIIAPIKPDMQGAYLGTGGRPADVALDDPLFQWTVYGRYQSGAECDKVRAELERRSLHLEPAAAIAVSWSFAKCLKDSDPLLRPNNGPIEQLSDRGLGQSVKAAPR